MTELEAASRGEITERVEVLSEKQSKALIKAYQIPVNRTYNATSGDSPTTKSKKTKRSRSR